MDSVAVGRARTDSDVGALKSMQMLRTLASRTAE
tara:strand:+ start:1755 stop:1856 length:102 start_codon:yes stop_codon:yes gene_type:complete